LPRYRILRGSWFYEDFVKTLLTINASWSETCRGISDGRSLPIVL